MIAPRLEESDVPERILDRRHPRGGGPDHRRLCWLANNGSHRVLERYGISVLGTANGEVSPFFFLTGRAFYTRRGG